MRKLILVLAFTFTACSTVSSSLKYTEGTKALEAGDFERAAVLLYEATELDPGLSRNHNNLASALFELDRLEEGWPHVRQAVELDPRNKHAAHNSRRYIVALLQKADLNTGASKEDIVRALGEPDGRDAGEECIWYRYGISGLCFKENRFAEIGDARYR